MKSAAAVACSLLVAAIALTPNAPAAAAGIWDGVFTEDQARRGERAYQSNCASCHGRELESQDPEAPPLSALAFNFGWHRKTLAERFELIKTTMPRGAVGALSDQEYLDIVVYILKFNGYPAGRDELKLDLDALKQIVIEPPK